MEFRKELGIDNLKVVIKQMGYTSSKDFNYTQKLATKNIKWAANDMWQFVNGWYDERKGSYREVFLNVEQLFKTIYKDMLTDIYMTKVQYHLDLT